MSLLSSQTCGTSNIDERESEGDAEQTADFEHSDDEMDVDTESVCSELTATSETSDTSRPNSRVDSFDFHEQAVRECVSNRV